MRNIIATLVLFFFTQWWQGYSTSCSAVSHRFIVVDTQFD